MYFILPSINTDLSFRFFLISKLHIVAELFHHLYERFIDDLLPALDDAIHVGKGSQSNPAVINSALHAADDRSVGALLS